MAHIIIGKWKYNFPVHGYDDVKQKYFTKCESYHKMKVLLLLNLRFAFFFSVLSLPHLPFLFNWMSSLTWALSYIHWIKHWINTELYGWLTQWSQSHMTQCLCMRLCVCMFIGCVYILLWYFQYSVFFLYLTVFKVNSALFIHSFVSIASRLVTILSLFGMTCVCLINARALRHNKNKNTTPFKMV